VGHFVCRAQVKLRAKGDFTSVTLFFKKVNLGYCNNLLEEFNSVDLHDSF